MRSPSSPIAVTSLSVAQRLTGLGGRITQLYVEPREGQDNRVRRELAALAGPNLDVEPATRELGLLDQAARPNNRSTELFAAISVMVGFLLALNAMLLTVPERRRFVADLRIQGYDWRQIVVMLAFQAIVLGLLASIAGVVLGDLLSHVFLHRIPAYLITAFPIGSQEILGTGTVAVAIGCGVLATLLASLSPALDLRPGRPADAALHEREGGSEVIAPRTINQLALGALASTALIVALVLVEPGLTIAGGVALALSTLCAIPALFSLLARVLRWTGERVRSSALIVVVSELRATTTRAVALAGIAALAVYGSVAIGGARNDLLRGLDANFAEYLQTADIWVTTGGNDLTTNAFSPRGLPAALSRLPGVASVRTYQGGFLDVGGRRLWLIARPGADAPLVAASQIVAGDAARADALLASSGWATVPSAFASEHHLAVGSRFSLPAPSGPLPLRVAAITTNLGWAPGAVVLNAADYARHWQTGDPSALEIRVRPGAGARDGAGAGGARDRPGPRRADLRRTAAPVRRGLAPGAGGAQPDRDDAADRGRARGGLGAERRDLAAPGAARRLEDPGVRHASAVARAAAREHGRARRRMPRRGRLRRARARARGALAAAEHRLPGSVHGWIARGVSHYRAAGGHRFGRDFTTWIGRRARPRAHLLRRVTSPGESAANRLRACSLDAEERSRWRGRSRALPARTGSRCSRA